MERLKTKNKKFKNKKVSSDSFVRLNKFISNAGICSRRKADEHILNGDVKINGKVCKELGYKVNTHSDTVKFKNKMISIKSDKTYIALFKPRSVLTSLSDPHDRTTVMDLIPKKVRRSHLFPVGRLDWNSEGLLLLTDDGDFAQNILHPKKKIPKTYEVKIEGEFRLKDVARLEKGVTIPGGKAKALKVTSFKKSKVGTHTWVKITVEEGRNHLIRKMMDKLGYSIMRLRRVSIGNLKVGKLKAGEWAYLNESQKDLVFKMPKELLSQPESSRKNTSSKNSSHKGSSRNSSRRS